MKALSIFVDESGDFGPYKYQSPYYIISLVFHDQSTDITDSIAHLNEIIRQSGFPENTVHAGPLIRKEREYSNISLLERKRIFNALYNFARNTDFSYHSIIIEKKQLVEEIDLHLRITKQLSAFLKENMEKLISYDRIVIYYDYGQMQLTKILVSVFNTILSNVEFRKVIPTNYKLFQSADLFCTLELLSMKAERKMLSQSELLFFGSARNLEKSYLRAIRKKRYL